MFNTMFWVLAIWFVVNVVWMWFKLDDQKLQKTFAWINICAIIIGFAVFNSVDHASGGLANWFIAINWINIIVAGLQFYYGYQKPQHTAGKVHHAGN